MVTCREEKEGTMRTEQSTIPRPVEIVVGAQAIGKFLKVSPATVQKLKILGAPIKTRGKRGDMVCDKAELWAWYKQQPGV